MFHEIHSDYKVFTRVQKSASEMNCCSFLRPIKNEICILFYSHDNEILFFDSEASARITKAVREIKRRF
jgi:hypothetical protein